MNTTEKPYESYVYAVRKQVEQHVEGLDQLSDLLIQRTLTFNERNAGERGLQVLVERAIGCSKHFLKSKSKPVPSEARASIEWVYELLAITYPPIENMRGAVGMRNAIIHEYLNLDWRRIESVMREKAYHRVKDYVDLVTGQLIQQC